MQNIGSWLPSSKSGLESRMDGLPILLYLDIFIGDP